MHVKEYKMSKKKSTFDFSSLRHQMNKASINVAIRKELENVPDSELQNILDFIKTKSINKSKKSKIKPLIKKDNKSLINDIVDACSQ